MHKCIVGTFGGDLLFYALCQICSFQACHPFTNRGGENAGGTWLVGFPVYGIPFGISMTKATHFPLAGFGETLRMVVLQRGGGCSFRMICLNVSDYGLAPNAYSVFEDRANRDSVGTGLIASGHY